MSTGSSPAPDQADGAKVDPGALEVSPDEFRLRLTGDAPRLDQTYILRALEFADKAHGEQKRVSGEPYIVHPLAVANTLVTLGMDTRTVAAGLLHDVLEDTAITPQQLEDAFGAETTKLVQGVTKIGRLNFSTKADQQAENLRKMLLAMVDDIRVIVIKLADRLHNLTTLRALAPHKQQRIAQETLEIYAPLAHRLGISQIQWQLEDLALRCLNPEVYFEIMRKIAQNREQREKNTDLLRQEVEALLAEHGVKGKVTGRPKNIFSIYRKTLKYKTTFDEIYDVQGVRVVLEATDSSECYTVLGLVHGKWPAIPGRLKDYISNRKPNGYQSLHTTVIHPQAGAFEVQIRTQEMDRIAERGVTAHWVYKDGENLSKDEMYKKFEFLRQVLQWHKEVVDSREFVDGVTKDLFSSQVYVFTPNGKVIELPAGSTPIDFAYAVHTEVGHACVGSYINGRMVPLTTELKTGQIVQVITNKNSKGPSSDWLDVVKSSGARTKIKQWIKRQEQDECEDRGRDIVLEELKKKLKSSGDPNLSPSAVLKSHEFQEALKEIGFLDLARFYASVGRNEASIASVLNSLPIFHEEPTMPQIKPPAPSKMSGGSQGVLVAGMGDMLARLSKCCTPMMGDPIIGYITRGRGVSVHRANCPNAEVLKGEKDRQVPVAWDTETLGRTKTAAFLAEVEARVHDRPNVLLKVTNVISNYKLNIHSANARVTRTGEGILNFSIEIQSTVQLANLLESIRELPEIITAYRVQPRAKAKPPAA